MYSFQNYNSYQSPFNQMLKEIRNYIPSNKDRENMAAYLKNGQLTYERLEELKRQARNLGIPDSQINQGVNFIRQLQNQ